MQPYESHPDRTHHHGLSHPLPSFSRHVTSRAPSATPIYDSLFAEYQRQFRALPGDRTGEEDLRFEGFGAAPSTGTWGDAWGEHARPRRALPALPPAPRDGHRYGF